MDWEKAFQKAERMFWAEYKRNPDFFGLGYPLDKSKAEEIASDLKEKGISWFNSDEATFFVYVGKDGQLRMGGSSRINAACALLDDEVSYIRGLIEATNEAYPRDTILRELLEDLRFSVDALIEEHKEIISNSVDCSNDPALSVLTAQKTLVNFLREMEREAEVGEVKAFFEEKIAENSNPAEFCRSLAVYQPKEVSFFYDLAGQVEERAKEIEKVKAREKGEEEGISGPSL